MKSLVILGSSGSIGENTLQVVAAHPDRFRVLDAGLSVAQVAANAVAALVDYRRGLA